MRSNVNDYQPETNFQYKLDYKNPQVVFVLGGPGSGKGTQCERLVRDYHFQHISVGDVMRAEIKKESPEGLKIKELVAKGQMVPDELTVNLLHKNIIGRKAQKYLIDGFPRGLGQAQLLESRFKEVDLILNFDVKEETLVKRLMKRGLDSGRSDDNEQTIRTRVSVFKSETIPVIEFYSNHGKVRTINGEGEIEEIYKEVQKYVAPEIIFFYGPPTTGKSTCAQRLSQLICFQYICLKDFYNQTKAVGQVDQVNKLISFLNNSPYRRVVIDQFFDTVQQAHVFFQHFSRPVKLFSFQAPKDQVESNIQKFILCPQRRLGLRAEFEVYLKNREEIKKYLQKDSSFVVEMNAVDSLESVFANALHAIKPQIIGVFDHYNRDLAVEYIQNLVKHRDFTWIDMTELCESEVERGTSLGKRMGAFLSSGQRVPIDSRLEMVRNIVFANLQKQRKFILTNFPDTLKQFKEFQTKLFALDNLMVFLQPQQDLNYFEKANPMHLFYQRGKLIQIDSHNLAVFDFYTQQQPQYGFIFGPQSAGQSTLAQHIAATFGYKLVDLADEQLIQAIQQMFTQPEEEPPAEVTYPMLEAYFSKHLNPQTNQDVWLFDGFTMGLSNLQLFIQKLGAPEFMINLLISKEGLHRRNKVKEGGEVGEAEIPPEELEASDKLIKDHEEFSKYLEQVAINFFGSQLFNLDVEMSLDSTQRILNSLFFRRVYVVNNYTPIDNVIERAHQKALFMNFAIRNQIIFVDISYLIKAHLKRKDASFNRETTDQFGMRWSSVTEKFPSHYSPSLIVKIIQTFLDSIPYKNREVLLYNYPSSDSPTDRKAYELHFPRASDQLYEIEKYLGPVRMVVVLTEQKQETQILDPEWVIPKPEPKKKKKVEGEEEEQGEENKAAVEDAKDDPPAEEGEENKPKFNIHDFVWTQSDGVPKSLSQWFAKSKLITLKKVFNISQHGSRDTEIQMREYLELLNAENQYNKEILQYRKVNLLVQICLDQSIPDEDHMENQIEK